MLYIYNALTTLLHKITSVENLFEFNNFWQHWFYQNLQKNYLRSIQFPLVMADPDKLDIG